MGCNDDHYARVLTTYGLHYMVIITHLGLVLTNLIELHASLVCCI